MLSRKNNQTIIVFLTFISIFFFSFAPQNGDPVAVLDHPDFMEIKKGKMTAHEFQKSNGLKLLPEDGKPFEIAEYELVYVPKKEDPIGVSIGSALYNDRAKKIIEAAAPGDAFYFENIKVRAAANAPKSEWREVDMVVVMIE